MNRYDQRGVRGPSHPGWGACVVVTLLFAFHAICASAATPSPWAALLAAIEQGYRPGIDELPRVAAALADAPEEVLVAWDGQGRFLLHAVGNAHEVRIPRSMVRKLKDSVLIHNHPSSLPPSSRDLDTVARYKLRRLYVAARVNGVISLAEVSRREALHMLYHGGFAVTLSAWRPIAATAPPFDVEVPNVVAAQIAYSLLGAWL